jgi:hypothetical protein
MREITKGEYRRDRKARGAGRGRKIYNLEVKSVEKEASQTG